MGVDELSWFSAVGGFSRGNALGQSPTCATRRRERRAAHYERPSMSRVQYGSRTGSRVSRRRVLAVAATVGAGVSVAGVAGLSLAGEEPGSGDGQPL
jgi:hypothetical protein